MAAPSPLKVQLFGHSFVRHLKDFIRHDSTLRFNLNLHGHPLVQYSGFSGARVETLHHRLTEISDFEPEIVVLIIGTNDIYDSSCSILSVANKIEDLVRTLLFELNVRYVVVMQCLHRCTPQVSSKYPVDTIWFNNRVDSLNLLLSERLRSVLDSRACLWRLKGFWTISSKERNFAKDGCHLSSQGQRQLYRNIRAAVVAATKRILSS
ncbi:hypothetical protein DPMN_107010 [Dreissena polymorpha]|uniref:SGNH hydrolase-type esterase domain-containing protein n=1 Tax=Dreissena polymorpha TaxID=45954 RepID=A0A9D4QJA6_DREPO|nr:hypothetical protein DPMN_107010 [Dreissena polymorpha]